MANPISNLFDNLIVKPLSRSITDELEKAQKGKEPFTWNVPTNWDAHKSTRKKNEVNVDSSVLRTFSVNYPVARSCIDYLTNRISELEWDITSVDGEKDDVVTDEVKEFFRKPYGAGRRENLKDLTKEIIEDLLVLDAAALYLERTRKGDLISVIPIDASTIKLRVDKLGRTPQHPEIAYQQILNGKVTAEMTTKELYYARRKRRTNSPYGLSPLESLILQVESALRGEKFNLDYFKEGNDPEGFYSLDVDYTIDQLKELQENFDAMMSGESPTRRRIKFMPKGTYSPTKRPEDMAFEKFEMWLMQQTCAVFGVPPQEIGFTHDVNRATSESQQDTALMRGVRPLASFVADIYTDITQDDLGRADLRFNFLDLDPTDAQREADIDKTYIEAGVYSVDEVRERLGKEPIGLDHYLMTRFGPQLVKDILNPPTEQQMDDEDVTTEIRRWRKVAMNDAAKGGEFRKFNSDIIPDDLRTEVEMGLQFAKSKSDVAKLFEPFLSREIHAVRRVLALTRELDQITYDAQNA